MAVVEFVLESFPGGVGQGLGMLGEFEEFAVHHFGVGAGETAAFVLVGFVVRLVGIGHEAKDTASWGWAPAGAVRDGSIGLTREAGGGRDPSLRLKSGSALDDHR